MCRWVLSLVFHQVCGGAPARWPAAPRGFAIAALAAIRLAPLPRVFSDCTVCYYWKRASVSDAMGTQIDRGRYERLRDANMAQVFSDVDSAYWTLVENSNLLRPYTARYPPLAIDVRERMSFSFKNGGAS